MVMRLKVVFDAEVCPSYPRALVEVKKSLETVQQFAAHLKKSFSCKGSIAIELDGFVIPPFQSITGTLRDNDTIRVKVSLTGEKRQHEDISSTIEEETDEELARKKAKVAEEKAEEELARKKAKVVEQLAAKKNGGAGGAQMGADFGRVRIEACMATLGLDLHQIIEKYNSKAVLKAMIAFKVNKMQQQMAAETSL